MTWKDAGFVLEIVACVVGLVALVLVIRWTVGSNLGQW
jgi:hypothetical protein